VECVGLKPIGAKAFTLGLKPEVTRKNEELCQRNLLVATSFS